jgi:hypothetical protein
LIIGYYREDKQGRIDVRRRLAEQLGVRSEALANRAQRLRDKLERCGFRLRQDIDMILPCRHCV